MSRYLLGSSRDEIRRLEFQARVWNDMTESLFDRMRVRAGWRCLDVGAGIGAVTLPLARRVGPRGEVTAIEASSFYADYLRRQIRVRGILNARLFEGDLRRFPVHEKRYDLLFSRWVFSFLPDPEACLGRLVPLLKPGGYLAIEDYHHLGCAYYPRKPSFERMFEATRAWFRQEGGNPQLAGDLPEIYRRLGLKNIQVIPHLRVGGPRSDVWKWAELFFIGHLKNMARAGVISSYLARVFRKDLARIKRIPGSIFVTPPIFDVVGRRGR